VTTSSKVFHQGELREDRQFLERPLHETGVKATIKWRTLVGEASQPLDAAALMRLEPFARPRTAALESAAPRQNAHRQRCPRKHGSDLHFQSVRRRSNRSPDAYDNGVLVTADSGQATPKRRPSHVRPYAPWWIIPAVLVYGPLLLFLDARVPTAWPGQHLLGALTLAVLWLCMRTLDVADRGLVWMCVVVATGFEILGSLVWGAYRYRFGGIPLFVPFGHGLIYVFGAGLAATDWVRRHEQLFARSILAVATLSAIAGLTVLPVWTAPGPPRVGVGISIAEIEDEAGGSVRQPALGAPASSRVPAHFLDPHDTLTLLAYRKRGRTGGRFYRAGGRRPAPE
jgi:hypothetical protein